MNILMCEVPPPEKELKKLIKTSLNYPSFQLKFLLKQEMKKRLVKNYFLFSALIILRQKASLLSLLSRLSKVIC